MLDYKFRSLEDKIHTHIHNITLGLETQVQKIEVRLNNKWTNKVKKINNQLKKKRSKKIVILGTILKSIKAN
jgi:hypothetical protein